MSSLDKQSTFYNRPDMWSEVLENLRNKIRPENFKEWIVPLVIGSLENETVQLHATDDFGKMWVEDNYLDLIETALAEVIGQQVAVEIITTETKIDGAHTIKNGENQLNLWPQKERAVPNALLRSALFGIVRRGRRALLNDELLASWRGIDLIYSGEQLNQNDLDVWMQAIHLHRGDELGEDVYFTWRGFLRDLGRHEGGKDIEWLKKTIDRLTKGHIKISTNRHTYAGGLLHEWAEDEYTGQFYLTANPKLARFFTHNDYTRMNWKDRLRLITTTEYTRWLHAFISSHDAPSTDPSLIRLEKLYELCGSTISRPRQFRARIAEAMEILEQHGHVTSWKIDRERGVLLYANR